MRSAFAVLVACVALATCAVLVEGVWEQNDVDLMDAADMLNNEAQSLSEDEWMQEDEDKKDAAQQIFDHYPIPPHGERGEGPTFFSGAEDDKHLSASDKKMMERADTPAQKEVDDPHFVPYHGAPSQSASSYEPAKPHHHHRSHSDEHSYDHSDSPVIIANSTDGDVPSRQYELVIVTANQKYAGTRSTIYAQVTGDILHTGLFRVGPMARDHSKRLTFVDIDVGKVQRVYLHVDGYDSWLPKRAVVIVNGNKYVMENMKDKWIRCSQKYGCTLRLGVTGVYDLVSTHPSSAFGGEGEADQESLHDNSEQHDEEESDDEGDDDLDMEEDPSVQRDLSTESETAPEVDCVQCTITAKDRVLSAPIKSNWATLVKPYAQSIIKRSFVNGDFTDWINCERRGAIRFEYVAVKDCGCLARKDSFTKDPEVPAICQQTSTSSYGPLYDRGHLVPANHFDYSKEDIDATNYITNILPQAKEMNRGAWLQTEEIIECERENQPLHVVGGAVWGPGADATKLMSSHGIVIPTAFWKVVRAGKGYEQDNGIIAWWVPNTSEATREKLDSYVVSIAELEKRLAAATTAIIGSKGVTLAEVFTMSAAQKAHVPAKSWPVPKGCDLK